MQERLVMIGGTIPLFQANRLKMGFLFSHETRHRLVALAIGDLCYGADRQADDKHLASGVHWVDDRIIEWRHSIVWGDRKNNGRSSSSPLSGSISGSGIRGSISDSEMSGSEIL